MQSESDLKKMQYQSGTNLVLILYLSSNTYQVYLLILSFPSLMNIHKNIDNTTLIFFYSDFEHQECLVYYFFYQCLRLMVHFVLRSYITTMRKISNNKSELVFVGLLSGKKYKYAYSSQTTQQYKYNYHLLNLLRITVHYIAKKNLW